MSRPKPVEPTVSVGLRLPLSVVQRADRYAAQLARETPGLQVTRTDVMRIILAKHLPLMPDDPAPEPSDKPNSP
jgi:hypothetical protein